MMYNAPSLCLCIYVCVCARVRASGYIRVDQCCYHSFLLLIPPAHHSDQYAWPVFIQIWLQAWHMLTFTVGVAVFNQVYTNVGHKVAYVLLASGFSLNGIRMAPHLRVCYITYAHLVL